MLQAALATHVQHRRPQPCPHLVAAYAAAAQQQVRQVALGGGGGGAHVGGGAARQAVAVTVQRVHTGVAW
jgi:hypothetical protein